MFQNPDRPPGWVLRDPAVLQALGQASRQNVRSIVTLANDRPRLAASLAGRFLDVGTGVGAMALEAAELCPSLQVVGLDIWEPSLAPARANVAASPHAARVEIRAQDVTQLDELAAYTLAWLAAPFLARPVAEAALDRLAVAWLRMAISWWAFTRCRQTELAQRSQRYGSCAVVAMCGTSPRWSSNSVLEASSRSRLA